MRASSFADSGLRALVLSSPAPLRAGQEKEEIPMLNLIVAGVVSIVAGGLILGTLNVKSH